MSCVQVNRSTSPVNSITTGAAPDIYLNSDVAGKVCLLSSDNKKSLLAKPPATTSEDANSVPDDIIHCSLPNLSPIHVNRQHQQHQSGQQRGRKRERLCNRHTICCGSAASVMNGRTTGSINAYCSPRTGRKQRPGSISTRDLSCLRAECYLKCKHQGSASRTRHDSGNSVDSDHGTLDSASHISTCATSDYAYMTSMDTIAMLCRECQKCSALPETSVHDSSLTPALSDLDIYTSLRRTHSDPENCKLEGTVDQEQIRDTRSCSELNENASQQQQQKSAAYNSYNMPAAANGLGGNTGNGLFNNTNSRIPITVTKNMQIGRDNSKAGDYPLIGGYDSRRLDNNNKQCKSIAISEENLVSRVSRWLSTVDHNGEMPDVF